MSLTKGNRLFLQKQTLEARISVMLEKSFSVSISFRMFTDWRFFKHARNSCGEKGLNEMAVAGFGKVKYLHLLLLSVFLCKRLRFLSVPIQPFVVAEVSQAYLEKKHSNSEVEKFI